jgi:hypothetical protein
VPRHAGGRVTKRKSMIGLYEYLENDGITPAEADLDGWLRGL